MLGCGLHVFLLPCSEQVKTLKLFSDGRDEAGRRIVAGSALIAFTADVPDRQRLMKSYEHSPYPPAVRAAWFLDCALNIECFTLLLQSSASSHNSKMSL